MKKKKGPSAAARPRRGMPGETRERLISAAADQFNELGYRGTDSNSIAKAAGYATGTFYKHFRDKQEIFLAAYERWLSSAWEGILTELSRRQAAEETARRIADMLIRFHTDWRGLRASLMELVFSDAETRAFFRAQRRRQLKMLTELRHRYGWPPQSSEQDAVFLWTTERTFDAMGQGEVQALGLDKKAVVESMVGKIREFLE
jgi:AcrR family transcriptional regulator